MSLIQSWAISVKTVFNMELYFVEFVNFKNTQEKQSQKEILQFD